MNPRHEPDRTAFLADTAVEAIADINRNLEIVLRLMNIADRAATAYAAGDYRAAYNGLRDYHALRQEHATDTPSHL